MAEPYEIESGPDRSDLPESVTLCDTPEDALESIASDLFVHAQNCVRAFGDFHLAVDGGWATERLCQILLLDPMFRPLPWKRTHLWVAADRSEDSRTATLLREFLVAHADLPADQFHPVAFDAPSPADRYEQRLREHLGWREKGHDRLDFVLLQAGTGGGWSAVAAEPPGGNASLVAQHAADSGVLVAMRPKLVRAARFLSVVAFGEDSRPAVAGMLENDADDAVGATMVGGVLRWYIDDAALEDNA